MTEGGNDGGGARGLLLRPHSATVQADSVSLLSWRRSLRRFDRGRSLRQAPGRHSLLSLFCRLVQDLLEGVSNVLQPALQQLVYSTVVLQAPEDVLERTHGITQPARQEIVQRPGKALQYLRVLRHGVEGVHQDGAHVVEAYLQEHLGPDPFYLQVYLVQPGVHADLQGDQAR